MNTSHILAFACGGLFFAAASFLICFVREWVLKRNHETERQDSYRKGYRSGINDGRNPKLCRPIPGDGYPDPL